MGNVVGSVGNVVGVVTGAVVDNFCNTYESPLPFAQQVVCGPAPAPTLAPTFSKTPTASPVLQRTYSLTVFGTDCIHLAGRAADVTIPPANQPWTTGIFTLLRHDVPPEEELQETYPPLITGLVAGDVIKVSAAGGISYETGFGVNFIPPEGVFVEDNNNIFSTSTSTGTGTDVWEKDGISGFSAPVVGPLVGLFLDDDIPNTDGSAPATLNFFDDTSENGGLGMDFVTLTPEIGQVFYIGNGKRLTTSSNIFHEFVAPEGATRVFFGVVDGLQWMGESGLYDDNDGRFTLSVGINQDPNTLS